MSTEIKGFADYIAGFRRHLKLAAVTFTTILIFGIGFAFSLPDIYESSAFILIEEQEIPEEIIRSTVTTYAARELTNLNEKILTLSNLVRIIEKYDLYLADRRSTPIELVAIEMRDKIKLEIQSRDSTSAGGLPTTTVVGFSVGFEDEDPETAKLIVDELSGLYLEENIKARSEATTDTKEFLEAEVARLEIEINAMESDLATFKEDNADRLPSLSGSNLSIMNRIDQDLMVLQRQLDAIGDNRISIKAQLATVDPNMPVRLADGSVALSPTDQLKALQTQLSIYESKYSDDHPDVIAARRDIASIKKRFGIDVNLFELEREIAEAKKEQAIASEKYTADHPDVMRLEQQIASLEARKTDAESRQLEAKVTPDNPAYISLQASLAQMDAEEAALRTQDRELRRRMADYETRLMQTPQVEKELAALTRDLSSTSNRYWVMRDKQFAAEMGETLETQNKGEEMILLEPARVPLLPSKPNRPAIITLAFLFALVAGVGATQLADSMDKSIRDSAGIVSVQGVSPIAEIPYIYSEEELAQTLKLRKMAISSIPAMMLLIIITVHFTLQPLDVLFYALAARLGF